MAEFFLNPGIAAIGLGLMALPIIIHLINLMRHRRVEWAAMEFLLESQKKNSTYVWLKQLLLLLLRMAAVAAIALIIGQLVLRNDFLASGATHHIVLLENSLSTSERNADDVTALERGKEVVQQIGGRAAEQRTQQKFTLLQTSSRRPLITEETVDTEFSETLSGLLDQVQTSELAVGPAQGINLLQDMLAEKRVEQRIIYYVGDFRANDWEDAESYKDALLELGDDNTQIVFVSTVEAQRPNLAVTDVKAVTKTRAADVPVTIEVTVKNFGQQTVSNIPVTIKEDGKQRPEQKVIESVAAGSTESFTFEARFPTAGDHIVSVELEKDPIEADNKRNLVLDFPSSVPLLLIDGDQTFGEADLVADALSPSEAIRTGLAPQIEPPSYLVNRDLSRYRAVLLFNISYMDNPAIENLEKFARQGGGVCFFVGTKSDPTFMNTNLYRDGEGLLPAPVGGVDDLLVNTVERTPDLRASEHPIFRVQFAMRNSFIDGVRFSRYYQTLRDWEPDPDSTVNIVARLRNDAPFAVEKRYGNGKVVVFLSGLGGEWNNWQTNPSFPITMLELQNYIASTIATDEPGTVGEPLVVQYPREGFVDRVQLKLPEEVQISSVENAELVDERYEAKFPTEKSGIYQVILTREAGETEERMYAFNVPTEESDTTLIEPEVLEQSLEGVKFQFQQSRAFSEVAGQSAETNYAEAILYVLILLLILEQLLAYFLSYHPASAKGGIR